jgi:hypothetical protein
MESQPGKVRNRYYPEPPAQNAGHWHKTFTHSHAQIDVVVKYIRNQDVHHQRRTFKSEYLDILKKNKVTFNSKYLFNFFAD